MSAVVAKTVLATTHHLELGLLDHRCLLRGHALHADGRILFNLDQAPQECCGILAPGAAPLLDVVAVDVCPVPLPDRVRGIVRIAGAVAPYSGPMTHGLAQHLEVDHQEQVGQVVPEHIGLEWRVEVPAGKARQVRITPAELAAADIDPLGGWESEWVAHLDREHRDQLRAVVSRDRALPDHAEVRPVHADVQGLVVRVIGDGSTRDLRLEFPCEVHCGCTAVEAFNRLLLG